MIHYPKCLYYIEKTDLDCFLDRSYLDSMIYDVILDVRNATSTRYQLKISALTVLNEAYAQATRIVNDKHPEDDFYNAYILDARQHLERRYEVELVFSVVYLILYLRKDNGRNVSYVLREIENRYGSCSDYFPYFKRKGDDYLRQFQDFAGRYTEEPELFEIDFSMHVDIPRLNQVDWKSATDSYNHETIRAFVNMGKTKQERRAILQAIADDYSSKSNIPYEDDLPF